MSDGSDGAIPVTLGLRDRKKAQQRSDLFATAVRLFREQGYDKVRMEDIAAAAEVATKTVYNYYPSKSDFLIEFLRTDRDRFTPGYENILGSTRLDVVEAVVELMMCDVGDVTSPSDRALWLEVSAAAIRARSDRRFSDNRWSFTTFLERLLKQYQERGQLISSLDTRLASDVLHTIYSDRFLKFCSDQSSSKEELRDWLGAVVSLTLDQWRGGRVSE